MAKFWYNMVIHEKCTLEQVPEKWRAEVEKMLEENE